MASDMTQAMRSFDRKTKITTATKNLLINLDGLVVKFTAGRVFGKERSEVLERFTHRSFRYGGVLPCADGYVELLTLEQRLGVAWAELDQLLAERDLHLGLRVLGLERLRDGADAVAAGHVVDFEGNHLYLQ